MRKGRTHRFAARHGWPSNYPDTYRLARRRWLAHPINPLPYEMKVLLMTLVLVLLLAGCAAGQGDGAGRTKPEETTANGTEETTTLTGEGGLPQPPDSTLSYGGQVVRGSLGSYCWGDMCADSVLFVPPRKKTLTVPSGSEMVFHYEGQSSPDMVKATATSLNKQGTSTAGADSKVSRSLKAQGSGVERTIPAELPPREYVVLVFVREPQGDASYFFRVMVE